ncbi:hypothetical protein BASA50_000654 [Batrachochytrium salamandrivorans]|uniref:Presenilin n=1 Tax=Batrachochytrium salamandrivorans TaxID=1357716 RepID=A0ABQ8ET82_9FUNG|nr:hypothetical protein BASA50_000654 [Batrachochytrium salamandrivorans]KAH9275960.1 hypothetical protein BASA83_001767 [Batrachochytrium salamandrivorans]
MSAAPLEDSISLALSLPKDINYTSANLAYGRQAISRLIDSLEDGKLHARQKALMSLSDLCHSPENTVQGIQKGLVTHLNLFLSIDDATCKLKATELLHTISGHAIGRTDIIDSNILESFLKLFTDSNDLVRKHIYGTLSRISTQKKGVVNILQSKLFVPIILRLALERMEVQISILETCYNCIRLGDDVEISKLALENGAMEEFTDILRKSLSGKVKVEACRCIMMLSFYHEGKRAATTKDTMLVLIALLRDHKSDVRAAAAGALMSITIDCDAKRIMIRENALKVLASLLSDSNELVQLNAIKTITNCAEDYSGRFQLNHCIQKLEELEKSSKPHVAKAAARAIAFSIVQMPIGDEDNTISNLVLHLGMAAVHDDGDAALVQVTKCSVCSKTALFMCSLCEASSGDTASGTTAARPPSSTRFYCSAQCQRLDWPQHKNVCVGTLRLQQERLLTQQQSIPSQQQSSGGIGGAPSGNTQGQQRQAGVVDSNQQSSLAEGAARRFTGDEEPTEEERIMDLRFYMQQIYTIIKPVMCCIILSVLWVKLASPIDPVFDTGVPITVTNSVSVGQVFGSSGNSAQDTSSLVAALVILTQIVVATIVIMCLFRWGQIKIIYGIFVFVVMLLLGYFGYTLGLTLLFVALAPLDYISFAFFIWNLTAVGLAVIFWKGPLYIQQGYLILMSSMMAFSLSTLPDLVTWILLGLLAIWDLIAVLCPYGPLRMLLESAQTQNQELPAALLYSAMVFMATPGEPPSTRVSTTMDPMDLSTKQGDTAVTSSLANQANSQFIAGEGDTDHHSGTHYIATTDQLEQRPLQADFNQGNIEMNSLDRSQPYPSSSAARGREEGQVPEVEGDNDDDGENGLKLGLGDFVFYSVLVGRASLFDWITTMSTIVAVTAGLSMTIFLLAVYRKPLPALPFSIAFGILFYFLSAITLTPFLDHLVIRPPIIIPPLVGSSLWVGKSVGGGMIYL